MSRYIRLIVISILIISLSAAICFAENEQNNHPKTVPAIDAFMTITRTGVPHYNEATGVLYFESNMSGTYQVYRLNDNGWPYQLTVFEDEIDFYRISPNGQMAIVGASTGGSEQAQLFLMETETGSLRQLTDNPKVRYGSVFWDNDSKGFYYRSNIENLRDFKIYYYGLATDEWRMIFDHEGANSISDISPDGQNLIIEYYYTNVENDLYVVEIASGKSTKLNPDNAQYEYEHGKFTADGKSIYVITDNNKEQIRKLVSLDIESRKMTILNPQSKWAVDSLAVSPNRRYLVRQDNVDGYSILHITDMETGQAVPSPDIKGRIKTVQLLNNGEAIIEYDSPARTRDVYHWNPATGELTQKTFMTYAGVDPSMMIEPELIRYKSYDGLEIPAFLYLPPGYEGKPVPFIIIAHGGPEGQYRPYFVANNQYFLLNGFGTLAPNVRGSKGYGKEYKAMDNYKNRLNSVKDYRAGVQYLMDNGYTEKGKIGIMGGSYGGYIVLAMITEYPDLLDAAVDRVGIANFESFLQNTKDYRRHLREAEYGPLSDPEVLQSVSPIYKAHLIKTPLLVIHGENDPRVPVGEARQIIRAVRDNSGTVDSIIFPDEGHGIAKRKNSIRAYRKIAAFFKEHLTGQIQE